MDPGNLQLIQRCWWNPPPQDYFKLNVDGSCLPSLGRLGAGGVLRDSIGNWIWGFSCSCGQGSSLLVELCALKLGLFIAWDKGCRKLLVDSDSLEAPHIINRGTPSVGTQFGDVILEIVELLHHSWDIKVFHVLREANVIADFLVKLEESVVGLLVLEHPPLESVELSVTDSFI
ncbi:Ribonuclease H domain [Sesbania bispinosa]|nr:Ribonuclease H domain [Sesbania bispinosa]